MFGVITKSEWLPFFALVGIGTETAYRLMPLIGMLDIAIGLSVLFAPIRGVLLYMVVWTVWTAALRPLTGSSIFEMLERAGNYGVPLGLLLAMGAAGGRKLREWFGPVSLGDAVRNDALVWRALSVSTALLLVGHGALAIAGKPLLLKHAALLGGGPTAVACTGAIEIGLAAAVLATPLPGILLFVCAWKIATELLFPISGAPVWEFIERGGSYAAPLALAVMALARRSARLQIPTPKVAGVVPAVALLGFLAAAPSRAGAQQRVDRTPVAPAGIFDSLREGGYVIACRHATTDHDASDRGPTRGEQRNITRAGEEEARSIGASIRALRIPVSEVRANPMYRNQETARYAFGSMVVDSSLAGRGASDALRAMLEAPVQRGTNRAVVTRIGILSGAMEDHGVRLINEADCFVVRPLGDDFRVLARIGAQDWPKAGR
jgi:hypothetical protein